MGTRHMIIIAKDNEYPVAQYGQWDGYPDGAGLAILSFLRTFNIYGLNAGIKHLKSLENDDVAKLWEDAGAVDGHATMDVVEEFKKLYPSLSRDTGSDILGLVLRATEDNPLYVHSQLDFVNDSLFCEWCYVIDINKKTFEVYKGFNTEKLEKEERFYSEEVPEEWYPVKHVFTFDIDHLPTNEFFIDMVEDEYEELEIE